MFLKVVDKDMESDQIIGVFCFVMECSPRCVHFRRDRQISRLDNVEGVES